MVDIIEYDFYQHVVHLEGILSEYIVDGYIPDRDYMFFVA
jgi:hypothetical protein